MNNKNRNGIAKFLIEHIKTRGGKWWVWQEKRGAHYFMCECDDKADAQKIKRALEKMS